MKIKSNDKVKIIAGKDKGKEGKVKKTMPREAKVLVEGVNIVKKHIKQRKQGEKGQKVTVSLPIDVSNVMLICPNCNKQTRVGYLVSEDGKKHRICKKCKQSIENYNKKE